MEYNLVQLFKVLMDENASDLHIASYSPPRLRVAGKLVPLDLPALGPTDTYNLCLSVLNEDQKQRLSIKRELDLSFSVKNLARFRANLYYESGRIAGTFRAIPFQAADLADLKVPDYLEFLCNKRRGIIVIAGQSGSGKTTTLASMLNYMNHTRFDHIVTIEDPIEYTHTHKNCIITQREIGVDVENFSQATSNILKQDPNIVMVSDIPDCDTLFNILTLAETGHLVLASVTTHNLFSTLVKFIELFPKEKHFQIMNMIAINLESVICQTLLPSTSGGKVLAVEHIRITDSIRPWIRSGEFEKISQFIKNECPKEFGGSLNKNLIELIGKGFISKEAALSKTFDPVEFQNLIQNTRKKTVPA